MPPKRGKDTDAKLSATPAGAASPKPKAPPPKTPVNIAAQAARNLGGFVPNKIFVGGVPITCTEEQFKEYFQPFGAISKVELHALRGFGYITYELVESVDACLERYEDHYLCKKWVEVKRSIPRELIDAYEREQRRLHAEYLAASGGSVSAETPAKPEPPTAPSVSASGTPGPWGASPSSSAPRKSSGAMSWGAPKEPGGAGNLSRIAQLEAMGFSGEVARKVLAECAWDVNAAIDRLLLSGAEMSESGAGDDSAPVAEASEGGAAAQTATDAAPTEADALPALPVLTQPTPASASDLAPEVALAAHEDVHVEAKPPASSGAGLPAGAHEDPATTSEPSGSNPAPAESSASQPEQLPPQQPQQRLGEDPASLAEKVAPSEAEGTNATPVAWEPTTTIEEVVPELTAAEAPPPEAPPRKRLEQAGRGWHAEDPSQLSISVGEFVRAWVDTNTDNGWIHAERADDAVQVGWLPVVVIKEMEEGKKWMRVTQPWKAMDENQCSVEEGVIVIVWVASRTAEGWTYIEVEADDVRKPGWLPAFCLEWNEN